MGNAQIPVSKVPIRPTGVHVMWTKPKTLRNRPIMAKYEVAILALSAMAYRRSTGSLVKLYTDNLGKEFFQKMGILNIWDEVDTKELENFNQYYLTFPGDLYENAGKTFIFSRLPPPFLLIDNDAVLSEDIPAPLLNYEFVFAHRESADGLDVGSEKYRQYDLIYPEPQHYSVRQGYSFNPSFNWNTANVINACLLYLNSQKLQSDYRRELENFLFMNQTIPPQEYRRAQYIFIEQRLLGLVSEMGKYKTTSFLDGYWRFGSRTGRLDSDPIREPLPAITHFHHLWTFKKFISKLPNEQLRYLNKLKISLSHLGIEAEINEIYEQLGYETKNLSLDDQFQAEALF